MYLPEEGILFAGDLVFNEVHPWLGYGFAEELKTRLTGLELMNPRIVIPGHGDPGGIEGIISTREYIEDLERIAREITDAVDTLENIERVSMPDKYQDWILGEYFYSNLKYMLNKMKE